MGRPPLEFPEPIPDKPENVARILMNSTATREGNWQYLKYAPPTGPYNDGLEPPVKWLAYFGV